MARSIEEAGLDLLAFLRFSGKRVDVVAHDEHTRKSQSRIPATDQDASVLQHRGRGGDVAFGLAASGQIVLRRVDGHAPLIAALAKEWSHVA